MDCPPQRPLPTLPIDYEFNAYSFRKALRERRGAASLRDAAAEVGLSASTLSRLENGREPDMSSFALACTWLQRPPLDFLRASYRDTCTAIPVTSAPQPFNGRFA